MSGRVVLAPGMALWTMLAIFPPAVACRAADETSTPTVKSIFQQARVAESTDQHRAAYQAALTAANAAIDADDYPLALQFLKSAAGSAENSRSGWLRYGAQARKEDVASMWREHKKILKDMKTLKQSSRDKKARVAVGRFLSFIKEDWNAGLNHLVKGNEPDLGKVAALDLNAGDPSLGSIAVAREWLALAEQETAVPYRQGMQWRSYQWLQTPWRNGLSEADRELVDEMMSASPKRYLSDMPERDVQPGNHPFGRYGDSGVAGKKILIDQVFSPYGLGLHPPNKGFAAVSFNIGRKYARFVSGYAISRPPDKAQAPVTFAVFGDGELLWRSPPVTAVEEIEMCQVGIKDVKLLELRTESTNSAYGAHCCWLEPFVAK